MDREILFRGRGVEDNTEFAGKWQYGDRLQIGGKTYIHPQANTTEVVGHLTKLLAVHEVDPSTVGQYAGYELHKDPHLLRGETGMVKLFEGDKVGFTDFGVFGTGDKPREGIVYWCDGAFWVDCTDKHGEEEIWLLANVYGQDECMEVVATIHNPAQNG